MILLFLISLGYAADPLPRPEAPKPVTGECKKVSPINRGQPLPELFRISPSSSPCSGVVVPLSDYADLLATEKWAKAVAAQYAIDTAILESDRDWYKNKLEEESKPPPFLERPGTQRWFGRLETLVTVGVVAVGLSAAYQYGSGGFK
jgi:hypothetical protein